MTLDETVERLIQLLKHTTTDDGEALNLGIEALKRIEDLRTYPDFDYIGALPSETEEAK